MLREGSVVRNHELQKSPKWSDLIQKTISRSLLSMQLREVQLFPSICGFSHAIKNRSYRAVWLTHDTCMREELIIMSEYVFSEKIQILYFRLTFPFRFLCRHHARTTADKQPSQLKEGGYIYHIRFLADSFLDHQHAWNQKQ